MKRTLLLALLAVCGYAVADVPGMKAGLWEIKTNKMIVDGKDMAEQMAAAQSRMQEAMARMTPEQRKQMGPMMQGMGAHNGSIRMCVSAAMAAQHTLAADPHSHCPANTVSTNGAKTSFTINCTKDGHTTVGTGEATISGDTITTHADIKSTDSRGSHTVVADTQMTYLGANCQGVKPFDEIAKGTQGK